VSSGVVCCCLFLFRNPVPVRAGGQRQPDEQAPISEPAANDVGFGSDRRVHHLGMLAAAAVACTAYSSFLLHARAHHPVPPLCASPPLPSSLSLSLFPAPPSSLLYCSATDEPLLPTHRGCSLTDTPGRPSRHAGVARLRSNGEKARGGSPFHSDASSGAGGNPQGRSSARTAWSRLQPRTTSSEI